MPLTILVLLCKMSFVFAAGELSFHPVYFAYSSTKLSDEIKEGLSRVAELLDKNKDVKLTIEVYAGSAESTEGALEFSQKRVETIKQFLNNKTKAPKDRFEVVAKASQGLSRPDSKHAGENRRIEFVFVSTVQKAQVEGLKEIEVLYWNTLYHSLYQIGNDQGFFEKEGFKMKLIGTNHSRINQVNAVCGIEPFLKEKVTVFTGAVCGGSPHYAASKGVPLVVIGGMLVGGSMLVAKKEMAEKLKVDWNNFKGITIGRPLGTELTSMMVADALMKKKIDPKKDVKWKDYGSHEDVIDAIVRGEVQAGDTYVPLNIRAEKQHGIVTVYNTVQLFPFHPCCRVITTRDKLKNSRGDYVKFMRALIRSHEYFVKQPKKSMEIIQRYTGYTMEEVVGALTNPNFQLNPDPLKNGFMKFGKMMEDTGYLATKVDMSKHIDTTVYKDALDGLIKEEPQNPYFKFIMNQFLQQNS